MTNSEFAIIVGISLAEINTSGSIDVNAIKLTNEYDNTSNKCDE